MLVTNPNKEIFFDLSVELFIVINASACIEEVNESWNVLGYSPEEMLGRSYNEFVYEADRENTQKEGEKVLLSGTGLLSFENRILAKDGSFRWISWSARGHNGFMYAAGRDVSQQKLKEENNLRIHEQLHAFVKHSPAAIAIFDNDFNIIEYSHRFLTELGKYADKTKQEGLLPYFLPLTDSDLTHIQEYLQASVNYKVSDLHFVSEGQPVYLELEFTPWFSSQNKLGGGICFVKNKTSEVEAFNQIRQQEELIGSIMQKLPVVVFRANRQGIFLKCNGAGLSNTGFAETQLAGKSVELLFPGLKDLLNDVPRSGNKEILTELKTGNHSYFFQTGISVDEFSGDFIGIAIEVSEKIKAIKELERAKNSAEKASISKSRFLANMSHEMRTPLNLILGFSDLLAKQELTSEQKEFISYIQSSGQTLIKLIQDILDLSKIEEGKVSVEEKSVLFKQAVTNSLVPYKYKANEKGLNFILQIDEFIPDYLYTDYDKIHQVLINLISNAIKFTRMGEIVVSISSEVSYVAGKVAQIKFLVSDTGIGVPAEKQKDIFNSFVQADSSISREYGGTGLGLSISRQLVKLLGGELRVISPANYHNKPGDPGSAFYFTLKIKVCKDSQVHKSPGKADLKPFARKYKILVVEDNLMNQKLAEVMLANFGCQIYFASDGKEAVEMVEKETYDLVLMDVQMPVLNGLEATRKIRETNKVAKIVGITAHVYKDEIAELMEAGMDDYLGKPYREAELYAMIKKYVPEDRPE